MPADPRNETRVRVDRIACSAHGVCHALDPHRVPLDEWGYPIPSEIITDAEAATALIRLCPAAALSRSASR